MVAAWRLGCRTDTAEGEPRQLVTSRPRDPTAPQRLGSLLRVARGLLRTLSMQRRKAAPLAAAAAAVVAALVARPVAASPAVDGTRNLSMGNVARASSYGTNAALLNPSNMAFQQVFAIEPMYQLSVRSRTNGIGIVIMDSLANSRVALGLGYLFMRGKPEVTFTDADRAPHKLELSHFGHEAFLALSVAVVKGWLSLGIKPKYQYTSLRYRDLEGLARNANGKLNAFGLDASLTVNLLQWAAVAVTGVNLTGNHDPAYTRDESISLEGLEVAPGTIEHGTLSPLSDYPLGVAHGLAVFPLRNANFSINFDGFYDFSTYRSDKYTRKTYGGSAEFVAGPVPIRFGTVWDSRGQGKDDDRVFVSGGIGFVRPAPVGGLGVDAGFGFSQQVNGSPLETIIGFNLGLRIHPDL